MTALQRRFDKSLSIELAALPARYGFDSVKAFRRAVRNAADSMAKERRRKSTLGSTTNRIDPYLKVCQNRIAVDSVNYQPSAPSKLRRLTATLDAPIRAVDLFAGAGGFSLAARNLGVKVVAAVENNAAACETYRRNFVKWRKDHPMLYERDLTSLTPEQMQLDCFTGGSRCDVIMGGPPCQGFSVHRINGAGVDDPRNGLLLRYFSFVRVLAPKVFILENVPGMLWPRHAQYLKDFYALANKSGYEVKEPAVLNAKDFGAPQNRRRVFILGIKRGVNYMIAWPPSPTHFAPDSPEVNDQGLSAWRPARIVFEKAFRKKDANRIHMRSCPELVEVFRSTPKNGGSRHESDRQLKCHKDHDGHKDVYGRIDPTQPGPTMTTACINPSKGRFVHPWLDHGIAARHAARFQGFPESFVFTGGLMAAGVQIGNAVPVPLGQAVLKAILDGIAAPIPKSEAA